jgi:Uma2 family endonuclease
MKGSLMAVKRKWTMTEFLEELQRQDDGDRVIELINGEIVEMPTFPYTSALAARLLALIVMHVMQHDLGHVTGADGGYEIDHENVLAPDVAFISKARQGSLPTDRFNPIPPDFAIEVVSVSDLKDVKRRIADKLAAYMGAGVPLVWYVYPERQEVEVYRPGQPKITVGVDGTLDGDDVLPGLSISVRDIFKIG